MERTEKRTTHVTCDVFLFGKCYVSFPYVTKHYDPPGISPRSSAVEKNNKTSEP
jgi:hypothetical protein